MKAPILEFYKDEGILNKETYFSNNKKFLKAEQIINKSKIDSALFIFSDEIPDFAREKCKEIFAVSMGSNKCRVFVYDKKFVIALAPLGSAGAAAFMEEIGWLGIKNFFACGSAGQIDHGIDGKNFILVQKAIRDEGASYHYLKPQKYVKTDKALTKHLENYLSLNKFNFINSTTWTTDGVYRETAKVVQKRLKQGAVSVEMECAGWCAVAKYRGYKFAQLLYFSDAIKQNGWQWKVDKKELSESMNKLMIEFMKEFVNNKGEKL